MADIVGKDWIKKGEITMNDGQPRELLHVTSTTAGQLFYQQTLIKGYRWRPGATFKYPFRKAWHAFQYEYELYEPKDGEE